jgi:NAD(P)-dependent dehydrogenase (short-subunit alcohol dehydrogenase family)
MRSIPQWPELEAATLRKTPSTRVGYPSDFAAMVAFLMSDEGSWVNGQVINIDGGAVLR